MRHASLCSVHASTSDNRRHIRSVVYLIVGINALSEVVPHPCSAVIAQHTLSFEGLAWIISSTNTSTNKHAHNSSFVSTRVSIIQPVQRSTDQLSRYWYVSASSIATTIFTGSGDSTATRNKYCGERQTFKCVLILTAGQVL
jgi:hypothetical protein